MQTFNKVGVTASLGIQSPCQMMTGVSNHLLSKVFRFHYHSQKVIGSLGHWKLETTNSFFYCINHPRTLAWVSTQEWLDASLFDVVRANQKGLHLSMVRILLRQLLEQLKVLQVGQGCLLVLAICWYWTTQKPRILHELISVFEWDVGTKLHKLRSDDIKKKRAAIRDSHLPSMYIHWYGIYIYTHILIIWITWYYDKKHIDRYHHLILLRHLQLTSTVSKKTRTLGRSL